MKQTIEIEVPEGKKAVWKNNNIEFIDEPNKFEFIRFDQIESWYAKQVSNLTQAQLEAYQAFSQLPDNNSFVKFAKAKMIVEFFKTSNNISLIEGKCWYPYIKLKKEDTKPSYKRIGSIKAKSCCIFVEVACIQASNQGLANWDGTFNSGTSWTDYASRIYFSVDTQKACDHIIAYFGKEIFEALYSQDDSWEWVK